MLSLHTANSAWHCLVTSYLLTADKLFTSFLVTPTRETKDNMLIIFIIIIITIIMIKQN